MTVQTTRDGIVACIIIIAPQAGWLGTGGQLSHSSSVRTACVRVGGIVFYQVSTHKVWYVAFRVTVSLRGPVLSRRRRRTITAKIL